MKTSLVPWIKTHSLIRRAAPLVGGAAFGQILNLGFSPIVSRLYGPSAFGMLAVYSALLTILNSVSSLRYEMAITIADDKDGAIALSRISFCSLCAFSLLLFGGCVVLQRWPSVLKLTGMSAYIYLVPIGVFLAGVYKILNYWALSKHDYQNLGITKIWQSVSQTIVQVASSPIGPDGLLLSQIAAQFSGSGRLFRRYKKELFQTSLSYSGYMKYANRYKKFPTLSSLSGLVNTSSTQLPLIMIQLFYGSHIVGWFSFSQKLVGIPIGLLTNAISQVYYKEASDSKNGDPTALRDLFVKTSLRLFLFGGLPISLGAYSVSWAIPFIFGDQWVNSAVFLRELSVLYAFQFSQSPLSETLTITESQGILLMWDLFRLVITVGLLVVSNECQLGAISAILFYSLSLGLGYIVLFLITAWKLNHYRALCEGE